MSTDGQLTGLLACPRCDKAPLSLRDEQYSCNACKITFPLVGGIPWLFSDADASLGEWRNRLHFELQSLAHEVQRLDGELADDTRSALTTERLQRMRDATTSHRKSLKQILAPIDVQSMSASYESYLALRTRLPTDQGLQTYYANLHRDWCWGEDENEASLAQIREVATSSEGGQALGNTLVLGAGAGRLAYDIHTQMETSVTIAVDFNPLLLLIAKSIIQGDKLKLYEFPIAPKSLEDFAVLRELSAPESVDEHFHLVLGDVLRPSFAAGQFDTVVTPWIIDIISEEISVFSRRINALLKPGGRWINFGSLAFDSPTRAERYSQEETLQLVEQSGFGIPSTHNATIPYMCSPASRHGRQETVFSFAATKTGKVKAPARHKALPDWIVTGKEPVPLLESFRTQAMTTQIYMFIMSMIDGKRSIKDMAKVMEQQKLMTRKEAEPAIRNFLTKMHDDAARQSRF